MGWSTFSIPTTWPSSAPTRGGADFTTARWTTAPATSSSPPARRPNSRTGDEIILIDGRIRFAVQDEEER